MINHESNFLNDVEKELPHLRRVARYLVNDKILADDIVYESVHRALSVPQQRSVQPGVRARLLKCLWLEHGRRRTSGGNGHGRGNGAFVPERKIETSARERDDERNAMSSEIEKCFQRLKEHERQVLLLVVISSMTYEETAFVLDASLDEVRKRLGSARNHLAALMDDESVNPVGTAAQLTDAIGT